MQLSIPPNKNAGNRPFEVYFLRFIIYIAIETIITNR